MHIKNNYYVDKHDWFLHVHTDLLGNQIDNRTFANDNYVL